LACRRYSHQGNHLASLADFSARLRAVIETPGKSKDQFVASSGPRRRSVEPRSEDPRHRHRPAGQHGAWQLKHAVGDARRHVRQACKPLLEASGNITLNNVSEIASAASTHCGGRHHPFRGAVDIGLDRNAHASADDVSIRTSSKPTSRPSSWAERCCLRSTSSTNEVAGEYGEESGEQRPGCLRESRRPAAAAAEPNGTASRQSCSFRFC